MINALSFDIEDYYAIVARNWLGAAINVSDCVCRDTFSILGLLSQFNVKGTFFIVGAVAKKFPQLVNRIVSDGHELGLHGNEHRLVNLMTLKEFEGDLTENIAAIKHVCGIQPKLFRAPAFSIPFGVPGYLDIMCKVGIHIDSSMYPFAGSRYGSRHLPRNPFKIFETRNQEVWELVLPTLTLGKKRIPFGGGGYLRLFPYWISRYAVKKMNAEGFPVVVYMHSYEMTTYDKNILKGINSSLGRKVSFLQKNYIQHLFRKSCKEKLERLLSEFKFANCSDALAAFRSGNA